MWECMQCGDIGMSKPRVLDPQEERICKENGVETEHVSVEYRSDDCIVLLNHRTRDNITIRKGERKWL